MTGSTHDSIDHSDQAPLSKTDYVLRRLRKDITSGVFQKGQQLRQTDVAAQYGVSATPVREALRLLAADGSISYSPHRGATVVGLSAQSVRDLYALRAEMEGLATEFAVERLSETDLDKVKDLHLQLIEARDRSNVADMMALNRQLHFTIYDGSSSIIASHIRQILIASPPFGPIWAVPEQASRLINEHELILDALTTRDGELARKLMVQHIVASSEYREGTL